MLAYNLTLIYIDLREMGLVRSKRQFSREFLQCGMTYLQDLERLDRDRSAMRIPAKTVAVLRVRLRAVARLTSVGVRAEIGRVLADIDRHIRVADALGYR